MSKWRLLVAQLSAEVFALVNRVKQGDLLGELEGEPRAEQKTKVMLESWPALLLPIRSGSPAKCLMTRRAPEGITNCGTNRETNCQRGVDGWLRMALF